jgi:cell division protein FtsQ
LKIEVKNKIIIGLWLLLALSIVVLLIAARQNKKHSFCSGSKVEISSKNQNYFVAEKDINEIINANGSIEKRLIKNIDIASLEVALHKNPWIKNVELFFDNNGILHTDIEQRQPIARLFTVNGSSTYIDKNALRLPIKNTATVRLLVVTGFTSDNEILAHADSLLLIDVKKVANFISVDTFWNAQIAQVNITSNGQFELIPTIGNHIIKLGNATNLAEKFNRLFAFYNKAWVKSGMDTYDIIDVRFNNQVVASRKGFVSNNIASTILLTDSTFGNVLDTLHRIN